MNDFRAGLGREFMACPEPKPTWGSWATPWPIQQRNSEAGTV